MNTFLIGSSGFNPARYLNVENSFAVEEQITSFAALPTGWHYGSGCSASIDSVSKAVEIVRLLMLAGGENIEAFPEIDGSILVSADLEDQEIEMLFRKGQKIEYFADTLEESLEKSFDEAKQDLGRKPWRPKGISVSFTPVITAVKSKDYLQQLQRREYR